MAKYHQSNKREPYGRKKKRKKRRRNRTKIHIGKSWDAIKRALYREKFGKK
jgi:hypothetical protein